VPEKCEKCGEEYKVGEWPWCPHGDGKGFGEEPLAPYLDWQLDPYGPGIEITNRAQRRKEMDKHALDYRDKGKRGGHVPGGRLFFDMGK